MEGNAEGKRNAVDPAAGPWHWRDCQLMPEGCYPTTQPANPVTGDGWYDSVEQIVYLWDGFEWIEIPED